MIVKAMLDIMPPIFAHAFGERYELPISLAIFLIGGACVVFISFLLILRSKAGVSNKKTEQETYAMGFNSFLGSLSFVVLGALSAIGILGTQEVAENILPTIFWLIIWIVVPMTCGILGNWTEALNPFSNIAKLTDRSSFRQLVISKKSALVWPKKLGWWPATILLLGLALGELVYNETATKPAIIGSAFIMYFLASAFLGLIYGRSWIKRGEVFSVLFSTWGKLGYFRFGAAGSRGFTGGLAYPFEASLSRTFFVLLLLISVSFDGLISTSFWGHFRDSLPESAQGDSLGYQLIATGVFLLLGLVIWSVFRFFAVYTSIVAGTKDSGSTALAGLLPSLVPISFGYLFAHNLEYVITNGQLMFPLIGNPTGKESWPIHPANPFNDSFEPNIHLLPSAFYWYIAVIVIVAVHIVAVILAHRHLGSKTKNAAKARQSEYPWIFIMIIYTMFSLWLLAQPLVKEEHHEEATISPKVALHETKNF